MLPVTCCLGISPWDMGLGTHNLTTYSCTHSIHHPVTCKQQAPQPKGQGTKRYGFTRKEHVCMHTCVCIRSCSRNVRVQYDIVSQSNWHIWHTHTRQPMHSNSSFDNNGNNNIQAWDCSSCNRFSAVSPNSARWCVATLAKKFWCCRMQQSGMHGVTYIGPHIPYIYLYIYVYMYIQRRISLSLSLSVYTYIYIHIYIYVYVYI